MLDLLTYTYTHIYNLVISPIFSNDLAKAAVGLSILGFIFYQIRSVPKKIIKLIQKFFIYEITIRDNFEIYRTCLLEAMSNIYLQKKSRKLQIDEYWDGKEQKKIHKLLPDQSSFLVKIDGTIMLCSIGIDHSRGGGSSNTELSFIKPWCIKFKFVKGTKTSPDSVFDYFKHKHNNESEDIPHSTISSWGFENDEYLPRRSVDKICINKSEWLDVYGFINKFLSEEEKYKKSGFPFRTGILVYGPPGTGKTTLSQVIATEFNLAICTVHLNDVHSDRNLIMYLKKIIRPSIILFEDIDCLFNSNRKDQSKVTLSGLLNAIDGVASLNNGSIIYMTTNFKEKIDPALIRAGRVDKILEMGTLDRQVAEEYLDREFPLIDKQDVLNKVFTKTNPVAADLTLEIRKRFA